MVNFQTLSKVELRAECKARAIKGYGNMKNAEMAAACEAHEAANAPVVGEFTLCPHCGIHLDNGYSDYASQCEAAQTTGHRGALITHEYVCLACMGEFGAACGTQGKARKAPVGTGIKIQKGREERNGVKRPSEGGICAQLWSLFDAMYAEKGMVPTPKPAKERSAQLNLDPVTTTVQLYRWRDFMGFKG